MLFQYRYLDKRARIPDSFGQGARALDEGGAALEVGLHTTVTQLQTEVISKVRVGYGTSPVAVQSRCQ